MWSQCQADTHTRTCDATEKAEAGSGVSFISVGETLPRERRHRDCHGDGLVEFPPSWLHGNDGAEGCPVTEDLLHGVVGYRLGLREREEYGGDDE